MIFPTRIVDGEIIEHKMAFDMTLNVLNNKDYFEIKTVKLEPVLMDGDKKVKCPLCEGGTSSSKLAVCDECSDKWSNNEIEQSLKRNKNWTQ